MQKGIKITGLNELRVALEKLPKEMQRTTETTALREGMKPVLKTARSLAPKGKGDHSGLLKKSIGMNVRKSRGQVTARVGPRSGFKKSLGTKIARVTKGKRVAGQPYEAFKDPVKYAHLVEMGTSRQPARPFIRPAVESNTGAITEGLAKGYAKGLEKAVRKLRKR
jgi:HK97 gp10 family phage protein